MIKKNDNLIPYYCFDNMVTSVQIIHGIFTRQGGVSLGPFSTLNTSYSSGDFEDAVTENIQRVSLALGISTGDLVTCNLVHGDQILVVTKRHKGKIIGNDRHCLPLADAMITNETEHYLFMSSADCAIVLIYDPVNEAIGLVHAGWQGIMKSLPQKTIFAMKHQFGSSPLDLIIGVTPSIGPCCYKIMNPLQKNLPSWKEYLTDLDDGRTAIDLRHALFDQLIQSGISPQNIEIDNTCTSCNTSLFFSYWAEKPKTGRMATVFGLRNTY